MSEQSLLQIVQRPRCQSYDEVSERLRAIDASLPRGDGLRWFNRLYFEMTVAVADAAARGAFVEPRFMLLLDCEFAALYFAALRDELSGGRAPHAWRPLFAARRRRDLIPLQFALAGVNAHINRDLAVALVTSFEALSGQPDRSSARFRDYREINRVLASVQESAKSWLLEGVLGHAEQALGEVDDLLALWSFERAREAAWTAGEVRWLLRGNRTLAAHNLLALDRFVGLTSRALLRPLSLARLIDAGATPQPC